MDAILPNQRRRSRRQRAAARLNWHLHRQGLKTLTRDQLQKLYVVLAQHHSRDPGLYAVFASRWRMRPMGIPVGCVALAGCYAITRPTSATSVDKDGRTALSTRRRRQIDNLLGGDQPMPRSRKRLRGVSKSDPKALGRTPGNALRRTRARARDKAKVLARSRLPRDHSSCWRPHRLHP